MTIPGKKKIRHVRRALFCQMFWMKTQSAWSVHNTLQRFLIVFFFFFPVDNNGHCSKIGEEVIEIVL